MNSKANREARENKQNIYLRVSPQFVDFLNGVPEFRDLSTDQLRHMVPLKYRKIVPPVHPHFDANERERDDKMARAVCVGMLATEDQIEAHIGHEFVAKTLNFEVQAAYPDMTGR